LDNPNPAEHDRERGQDGIYDAAIQGMQRVLKKGIFVGISSYASRTGTSRGDYKKMHVFAKNLHLHNVILFDCVPTGNLLKDTSNMLTPEQRDEIYQYSAE
jgi:MoaA/NifB/PqqE/SkfB family radical SAM enzyme